MRILTRYILGEILSHALIGCALFTFILFIPRLPQILEMVVRNSSTFANVLQIFLFTLPNLFWVTIPMSVLVGILLGLSRLAADSEIIAMRASGLGVGYFVRVASIVAIGGALLGLVNSLYIAPRANQAILDMEQSLAASQASYQIQPRVFYEDFRNFVLYVQDVRGGTGASNWGQVFMADVSDPDFAAHHHRRLGNGRQRFKLGTADAAARRSPARNGRLSRSNTTSPHSPAPICRSRSTRKAMCTWGAWTPRSTRCPSRRFCERTHGRDGRRFLIELNNRFSYPAACLVLMLVGVPLGVISRRGGKSSGFVFTLLLVILYYILSYTGVSLARQNKLPVFRGVWMANMLFAAAGIFLLWQMASGGRVLSAIASFASRARRRQASHAHCPKTASPSQPVLRPPAAARRPQLDARRRFPASSMSTWFANSSTSSSWCCPALSC